MRRTRGAKQRPRVGAFHHICNLRSQVLLFNYRGNSEDLRTSPPDLRSLRTNGSPMRKTFLGVKLRTLREQRGLTQAALAQRLELSPSYLNQLENNQRPLSVAVQLRLQSSLGVDLQVFSDDDEA